MDLKPLAVFLHDPSADSIQDGLETGEFSIGGVLPFIGAQVTACDIACATPCLTQSWSITFADVDFGTCNDCGLSVAFNIRLRRQSNFDIEDYLHLTSDLGFTYEPDQVPSGVVTAATQSAYFLDFLNNGAYDDEHDFFGITAVAGAAGEIILTVPCPIQVDIFQSQDSEPLAIVETVGQTASLTKAQLMKEYPLMIGYVPGQNVDDTFTQCEDICVIHISGCIPGCVADAQNLLTTNNAVHLHDVGTKFSYKLFVNSSGPGYADFIDELNAAVGVCSLDAIVGSQVPFVTDVAAASLDLTTIGADAGTEAFGTYTSAKGSITNGTLTVYFDVTGAPVNVSDIVGAINTATGSATPLTHAAGVITLAAPFDTGVVTIKVVTS
jgi:hypothetical protein